MNKKILVFKRKVKYLRLEVSLEEVKIILPENYVMNENEILKKHSRWIKSKIERLNEINNIAQNLELYNNENLNDLINSYIEEIGEILKTRPIKILFRKMKIRWGSCYHKKKIIIFNKFLKYLPKELIKYVVLHEMCHLIIRNHKKEFWLLVKKLDPEFKEKEKLLAGYRLKINFINT